MNDALTAAATKRDAALRAASCESLNEAAAAVERRAVLERQIEQQTTIRETRTGGSLDGLRRQVSDLKATLAETAGPDDDERPGDPAPTDATAAEEALAAARRAQQQATRALDQIREERDTVRTEQTRLTAAASQRAESLQAAADRLAAERLERPDDALREDADAKRAVLVEREAEAARLKAVYEDTSPEDARLALKRATEALETVSRRVRETEDRILQLEASLAASGQRGLGEQEATLKQQLAETQARHDSYQAEAAALTLLYNTLTDEERAAKDAFIGPVRERIKPYLRLVFPGADLALDTDSLSVAGLSRDGADEPFETLSIGTREQIAVLARLALADFLLEKGQPVTVILDDTPVYADGDRFQGMLMR